MQMGIGSVAAAIAFLDSAQAQSLVLEHKIAAIFSFNSALAD